MMMRWGGAVAYVSLVMGCVACSERTPSSASRHGAAVDGVPSLRALQVAEGAIVIDGRLDEPVWAKTGATGPFVHPADGRPRRDSPVNASARVVWDAAWLYVGFIVDDRDPTSPFAADDVDPQIWTQASGVELMIQPGDPGNNRHYYEIQVDVAGAVWDTRFDDYNKPLRGGQASKDRRYGHQDWSSGVRRSIAVDRRAGRYRVELAVPWPAFSRAAVDVPPRPGDVWRMNLYSFRDGQRHAMAWSPLLGQGNFHKAARFGRVVFVGLSANKP